MQLRYLSTLATIGQQNNSTIVFPFPTDFAGWLRGMSQGTEGR
jgi:hypothetical protein